MGATITTALVIGGTTCHYVLYLPVNITFNILSGDFLRNL